MVLKSPKTPLRNKKNAPQIQRRNFCIFLILALPEASATPITGMGSVVGSVMGLFDCNILELYYISFEMESLLGVIVLDINSDV